MEVYSENIELDLPKDGLFSISEILKNFEYISGKHIDIENEEVDGELYDGEYGWIVTRYHVKFEDIPSRLEKRDAAGQVESLGAGAPYKLSTWAGRARFGLFPRYYLLEDAAGGIILRAASQWAVMDLAERRMITQKEIGVDYGSLTTGNEIPMAKKFHPLETDVYTSRTVTEDDIDVNGHMNNTRYMHWLEELLDAGTKSRLTAVNIFYSHELMLGDTADIRLKREDGKIYMQGELGDKICVLGEFDYE